MTSTFTSSPGNLKPAIKAGIVAAGYVGAFLVAWATVAIRVANTNGPDAQAASGMYAFGDSLLFVAVFGVAALVPTGMALIFLKPYRTFWIVLSALGLCVAATGAGAVILYVTGRQAAAQSPLAAWSSLSVLRLLVAPVLAPVFLLSAVLSPRRFPRFAFLAATAMEAAVSAYIGFAWFLPLLFPRS